MHAPCTTQRILCSGQLTVYTQLSTTRETAKSQTVWAAAAAGAARGLWLLAVRHLPSKCAALSAAEWPSCATRAVLSCQQLGCAMALQSQAAAQQRKHAAGLRANTAAPATTHTFAVRPCRRDGCLRCLHVCRKAAACRSIAEVHGKRCENIAFPVAVQTDDSRSARPSWQHCAYVCSAVSPLRGSLAQHLEVQMTSMQCRHGLNELRCKFAVRCQ